MERDKSNFKNPVMDCCSLHPTPHTPHPVSLSICLSPRQEHSILWLTVRKN
ncbi:unknown protein [Microcystis aeruginosa NIES-843]|uniref:Uncharacterized protein n=1 Tax=Microcystis aeruginosa (strain NIES-843 / IAM M-2473) TaxID=449447 RepID=B0JYC9_MICAN|nr:unknown protein [Microcystis aeruginosa NIES-843]